MAGTRTGTRTRIIEAGNRTFYGSGFTAVRVEDVLQEADASRGSFYKFFHDKNGLAEEVLKTRASQYEEFLVSAISRSDGLAQGITAVFFSLIEWAEIHGSHGCMFQTSIIELGDQPSVINIAVQHKKNVQEILRQFLADKDCPEPEAGSGSLMLLIEGAVAMANFDSPQDQFLNALDTAQKLFNLA